MNAPQFITLVTSCLTIGVMIGAIVRSLAHDSAHEKAREIICDIRADVAAKYKRQERDLCPVRIGDRMYYEPCAGSPEE